MRMLVTLSVVVFLGAPVLPLAKAHPCDSLVPITRVCDPHSGGAKYYVCTYNGPVLKVCRKGLVFNNNLQVCDWPRFVPPCVASPDVSTEPTTTPTSTAFSTSVPTTTTSLKTTTSSTPTTTLTTTKPTTRAKVWKNPCGNVQDGTTMCDPATNGTTFIKCNHGLPFIITCPPGTVFHQQVGQCDWPFNIVDPCLAEDTQPGPAPTGSPLSTPVNTGSTTTVRTTTTTAPLPTGNCNRSTCTLPDCRCLGIDIPGNLSASDVPQMVLLTFDDAISNSNFMFYDQLFPENQQNALKSPGNCSAVATFFVSNDGANNFERAKTLWQRGNEMASHSLTHGYPPLWNSNRWQEEMQGMRQKLAKEVNVTVDEIRGMRTPYLELGGELQFSMMQNNHFTYDTSMFGGSMAPTRSPPVWPFTLHYPPPQSVCDQGRCPQRSYPGVWEVPLIRQYSSRINGVCSMTDSCPLPANPTADDVKAFLRHNFDRHYSTNRAPFMISLHATWFSRYSNSLRGLKDFLQEVRADLAVRQVTVSQMLDWVRHPVPLDRLHELPSWVCP